MHKERIHRPLLVVLGFALLATLVAALPRNAYAASVANDQDLILGVFFNSEEDWTNSIYVSTDGLSLNRVASVYSKTFYDTMGHTHNAQYDPSIIYYKGYFWSLSGWNRNDDKIWVMISYSKDLVHWTYPEGDGLFTDGSTRGISYETAPAHNNGTANAYDTVAPEWYLSKDGNLYIIVSAGYYGDFHQDSTNDYMQAYIIKVDELRAADGEPDGDTGYLWPQRLTFKAGPARLLGFSAEANANFIDGAGYTEAGSNYDYLVIKKDGLTNQIYRTSNIDNPNSWQLVNERATFGYEGASIAKLGGTYYLYADHVTGATADGVRVATASSIDQAGAWSEPAFPVLMKEDHSAGLTARHGSVLTLKAGTPEWKIAKALYEDRVATFQAGTMWRLYNPNSGEHFYTASDVERNHVVGVGWNFEGIGWIAPASGGMPVYRLYNQYGGEHHYTTDAGERDMLVGIGWNDEGIGWQTASDRNGIPLYRLYNPNAFANNHHYTTSEAERDHLISIGWNNEGIGWYGTR